MLNVITGPGTTTTKQWIAAAGVGSGTLTLSTLTSNSASDSFSFTAAPVLPDGLPAWSPTGVGYTAVTNGLFDIKF
jgi:hypothetical protein